MAAAGGGSFLRCKCSEWWWPWVSCSISVDIEEGGGLPRWAWRRFPPHFATPASRFPPNPGLQSVFVIPSPASRRRRRALRGGRLSMTGKDASDAIEAWPIAAPDILRRPPPQCGQGDFLDLILFARALHGAKFTRRHPEVRRRSARHEALSGSQPATGGHRRAS
jgi:hypothetical protein